MGPEVVGLVIPVGSVPSVLLLPVVPPVPPALELVVDVNQGVVVVEVASLKSWC